MKLCIHKRKRRVTKDHIWCNYFRKVYHKNTCDRCHKSKYCGRYITPEYKESKYDR